MAKNSSYLSTIIILWSLWHLALAEDEICSTASCRMAAKQIIDNLDNKTEPCDDFYQFACGRWAPPAKPNRGLIQPQRDLRRKLNILIERQPRIDDPPVVGQLRTLMASCMNLSRIDSLGSHPLLTVLNDLDGWPVMPLEDGQTYNTSWIELLGEFKHLGLPQDMLMQLSVVVNKGNRRHHSGPCIAMISRGSFSLPDQSYPSKGLNVTATVAAYYTIMVESALNLGGERNETELQMIEVLEFEYLLANISSPTIGPPFVSRMNGTELREHAPNIDWQSFFTLMLDRSEFNLTEEIVAVEGGSNYLRELDALLHETDAQIVANYLTWRLVEKSLTSLSKGWRRLADHFKLATSIGRPNRVESRWDQCIGAIESLDSIGGLNSLSMTLWALDTRDILNEQEKSAANELVGRIREEFIHTLMESHLFDGRTRRMLKSNTQTLRSFVGYSDRISPNKMIEDCYRGVQVEEGNFFMNMRRLRVWSMDRALSQLRGGENVPSELYDWRRGAAERDTFYDSEDNYVVVPLTRFRSGHVLSLFDAHRPNCINFGTLGYLIGHEMSHGLDGRCCDLDERGNTIAWWFHESETRFKAQAQCLIEQYNNYTISELPEAKAVNGTRTLSENIADNLGLKQAFRAYRRWTQDGGDQAKPVPSRLPGLDYSPDQLFWLSYANLYCSKSNPEVSRRRADFDKHSPFRYSVIGPLSNAPEFAAAFNCPVGSPMNPAHKCPLW